MTTQTSGTTQQPLVIEPPAGWQRLDLIDLWRYRDMIWLSVLRDITSRYKQSMFGPLWIVMMPLVSAGLFSIVLGGLAGLPSEGGVPYPVMVYTGMLMWGLFSRSFQASSDSIAANQHLISKVYYPRLVSPIAGSLGGLLDFVLGLMILGAMLAVTGVAPSWWIVAAVPVCAVGAILGGMSLGLWIASASVRFRDLRYASSFLLQIGLWMTPVAYSSALIFRAERIPEAYRGLVATIFQLNPMFVIVEGFRSVALDVPYAGSAAMAAVAVGLMLLLLLSGMLYFRRVERTVADIM